MLISCAGNGQEESHVSIEEARLAAKMELMQQANTGFPVWVGAILGKRYTFYDLREVPSAYLFTCEKRGQVTGYITVSASKRFAPIFESSTSDMPPPERTDEARLFAQEHLTGAVATEDLIFLGGLQYYVQYTTQEGQQAFVDLSFPVLRIEDRQAMERKQRSFEGTSVGNAEEAWNAALTPTEP
jgi:hypothetical protein